MQDHERQLILDQLTASRDRLLELVDGLNEEQWKFRPAANRWSIGDCLEHVTCVENRIFGLIAKKMDEGPSEPEKRQAAMAKDVLLIQGIPDRTTRRQAPEAVLPTGNWLATDQLLAEFLETRHRTAEYAAATQDDLRSYFQPHAAFGELDCYQWLLVASLHGARHAKQIEEVKAAPDFPAGELTAS